MPVALARVNNRPGLRLLAALFTIAIAIRCSSRNTPTEPIASTTSTPTPTAIATPAPPTPTNTLTGAPQIATVSYSFPSTLHLGDSFMMSASCVGLAGIGVWDIGGLQFRLPRFVDAAHGQILSYEGQHIGETVPSAEGGGFEIVVTTSPFTAGSRVSFQSRNYVKAGAIPGTYSVTVEAVVTNAHGSLIQSAQMAITLLQ